MAASKREGCQTTETFRPAKVISTATAISRLAIQAVLLINPCEAAVVLKKARSRQKQDDDVIVGP